jgi:hypothetical protein
MASVVGVGRCTLDNPDNELHRHVSLYQPKKLVSVDVSESNGIQAILSIYREWFTGEFYRPASP